VELLLTVTHPDGGGRRRTDVVAELDPFTSVGLLGAALAAFLADAGHTGAPAGLARGAALVPLAAEGSVHDAGIVSGDELHLVEPGSAAAPAAAGRAAVVVADVTSGPGAGRSVPLAPGRHVLGRSPDSSVAVDDATLSVRHLVLDVAPDLAVHVEPDPGATNGTLLDGSPVTGRVALAPEQTLVAGRTALTIRPAPADGPGGDRAGPAGFNRSPYRRPVVRERPFDDLDAPPETPAARRFSLTAVVVPLAGSAGIVAFTHRFEFLALAGLSPLMVVANHLTEGRQSRRSHARSRHEFLAAVDERATRLDEAVAAERAERFAAAPDLPALARRAATRSDRLWERHRGSPDVLQLRIGLGERPTLISSAVRPGGDPSLRRPAEDRLAAHRSAPLVPVTVDLDAERITGLYGEPEGVRALGAALAVQAACLHSPEDVVIAAALPAGPGAGPWSWLKWLPHTRAVTSPLEGPHLVPATGTDDLLARLLAVAGHRGGPDGDDRRPWPRVLVLLPEDAGPDRSVLAALLDAAPGAGIDVVWLGHTRRQVPRQCRALIHAVPAGEGPSELWFTDPARDRVDFEPAGVGADVATAVARSLAPVRDVGGRGAASAIPRVVPLLDVLALPEPTGGAVAARWARDRPDGLAATIGAGPDGPLTVDLVHQGPHALVAGTSGAGKSELLQTLVLALAADHPPERLTFLFIDYKGGASSAPLGALPHTVGQVTNLDGRLSRRALASLRAELQRRMALLEGRARDLAELRRVAPDDAPPSLVIVADEFATLVTEIPDFVAGVVDIAQRGRSLGIHLVLATQRPSGAVNDQILANTNLRIALRVLDAADSTSIIGGREAADIPVPLRGRGFVRTGPGAPVSFQCAWSGAPRREVAATPVSVRPFALTAGGPAASAPAPVGPPGGTHLEAVVRACRAAADERGRRPPSRPWVEPLPVHLALDAVLPRVADDLRADPGRCVVVGLADDPASQSQDPVVVDLEASGGLVVFGAGGAGKTTLLRTVAAGVARQGGADAVVLYGLDFAGRALGPIGDLPQTAAVLANDEVEGVTRLLTVLRREIDDRRRLLADARAESLSALRRQRGALVVPRIVVLLDGYGGFHAAFEPGPLFPWIAELQAVVSEGRPVGVHVVMTAARPLGIPGALVSAMGARVVLRMAHPDDLLALGVPRDVARDAELPDGRGFVDGRTELQVATAGPDPSGSGQAAALARLAARGGPAAAPLPELPALVRAVPDPDPGGAGPPLRPHLGVADLSLEPVHVELGRQHLVVVGPPLSGRSAALATVAAGVAGARGGPRPRLVGVGGAASPLAGMGLWDAAGFGRAAAAEVLAGAAAEVAGAAGDRGGEVRLVLVVDAAEDVESPGNGPWLEALVRSDAVRVVAVIEPATLARAYSGWTAELRANRSSLVLQPASAGEVEALAGSKPVLRPGQPFPAGRGVLVDRRSSRLVQVALAAGFGM
jgi:S-DNA-T family DNA segregation ATPase FtsK/SpoIIIE